MDNEHDLTRRDTADRAAERHPPNNSGSADAAQNGPAATAPGGPTAGPPEGSPAVSTEAGGALGETTGERRVRKARRVRLYVYVFVALAVVAYLIALGAANTASVDVSWVFGTSAVPLVWLVLSTAVLGVTLGILVSLLIRWRTRRRKKTEE